MQENNRLLSLFGMARRCGKIAQGFDAAAAALRTGAAFAVFIAQDISPRTERNVRRIALECETRITPLTLTMRQIGEAIGCAPTAVLALTERGFANKAAELAAALHLTVHYGED